MRAQFHFTQTYLRKVHQARAFQHPKLQLFAILAVTIGVPARWALSGEFDWLSALALGSLGFYVAAQILVFLRAHRFAKYYVEKQGDEPVDYEFTDAHLAIKSKHAEVVVPWSSMCSLSRGDHHWTLRLGNRAALTLPPQQMSGELQRHVLELARRHGLELR